MSSIPDGLIAWTSRSRAAEAAKRMTAQTGTPHRAVKSSYFEPNWDVDPLTWEEIPCWVLQIDTREAP